MNLPGALHLGLCYLRRHRGKTALLIAAISLSLILPFAVAHTVRLAEQHLRARADSTPLIFGAAGSELELVFNSLYFSKPDISGVSAGDAEALASKSMARVIPIHARFSARGFPVIGTSLDYFEFRQLTIADGGNFIRLGDCVLGTKVAKELGLAPGDSLITTPDALFDMAGTFPLKMRITGVLAPSGGPDDNAVFADTRTSWVVAGLAHGHQDATTTDEDQKLKSEEGDANSNITLNASVVQYNEVTPENIGSFHFHGDPADFPLTASIVLPRDTKAETLLFGRYADDEANAQLLRPRTVMDDLFDTVFRIRDLVLLALAAVALAAAAIAILVFALSNRLRTREFQNLENLGADPATVRFLVSFEAAFVIVASIIITASVLAILHLTSTTWLSTFSA